MEDLRYSCPICYGNVLSEDMANRRAAPSRESLATLKLYCPHCEMIVEPVITTAEERSRKGIGRRDAGTENRGRAREGGSNAGGSQRGDLSDQGASQWRCDPLETERNSWQDKR